MSNNTDEAAILERVRQLELERRAKRQELRGMLRLALAREHEWRTRERKEQRYLLSQAMAREKAFKQRRPEIGQVTNDLERFQRRNDFRKALNDAAGHPERCALIRQYRDTFDDPRFDLAEHDIDDLITEIRALRRQLEERTDHARIQPPAR